jgi:2-polyprenyl-6-methoxyphenol hydroxylase-like FAD-dependent oxidoreductase
MDTVTLAYRQGCVVSEMGSASQHVVVVGAGMSGLFAAMLLARDGHRVTVLERDPAAPPAPDMAWEDWERRGCGQFRLPHYTQPKFRHLLRFSARAASDSTSWRSCPRRSAVVGAPRTTGW